MQMKFCMDMKIQHGQQVGFENKTQEVLCVNHGEMLQHLWITALTTVIPVSTSSSEESALTGNTGHGLGFMPQGCM